ncbi:putative ensconsin-like [Cocos nucifera]|nr:putative ensconsin-like [Cocos nucifera]
MDALEVTPIAKAPPTTEFSTTAKVVGPPMPPSPPTKAPVLEPPTKREEAEKKKIKRMLRKSQRKAHHNGPNSSDEELRENPFNNHEIIKGLVNGFTIPEVIDRIIDADIDQHTWDLLGSFLKTGHQLLGYIRSLNHLKSELVKAQEDH